MPEERRKRESEQRRRAFRHFHRQRDNGVSAWEFAVSELRKVCPVPFATQVLAEYVGRVNVGAPLDRLSDDLNGIAALLAQNDAFTPILLDKLRVAYPAVVDRLDLTTTLPVGESKRITWQVAKKLAEAHCARNPFPGVNALAKIVGCSPSTMSKVVHKSATLRAKLAEHKAGSRAYLPWR